MTPNLFSVMSKALWERGEDGEGLAGDLAVALADIISEGVAAYSIEMTAEEFKRLLQLREWQPTKGGNSHG